MRTSSFCHPHKFLVSGKSIPLLQESASCRALFTEQFVYVQGFGGKVATCNKQFCLNSLAPFYSFACQSQRPTADSRCFETSPCHEFYRPRRPLGRDGGRGLAGHFVLLLGRAVAEVRVQILDRLQHTFFMMLGRLKHTHSDAAISIVQDLAIQSYTVHSYSSQHKLHDAKEKVLPKRWSETTSFAFRQHRALEHVFPCNGSIETLL